MVLMSTVIHSIRVKNEREEWLKQAEKIAYEQLVVELSKNGKKISYLILGSIMRII